MKKVFLTILLALFPILCFAQIRSNICIVRPNYSEHIIDILYTLVPQLKRIGVDNPYKYLEDFISKGSSGSGFIYVAPNGKNYVITNRHVICDANTSTVIFQNEENDSEIIYNNLTILAANDELDLAILEFPNDERPFSKGINFFSDEIKDGDAIFTAGYPSLMGVPTWQFGSGIITNKYVKNDTMIKSSLSSLIQHSAQVDAGNSGGPLLIKNSFGEYEIVGINTWKLYNRQDTNFAVPVSTIKKFIDDALNGTKSFEIDRDSIIIERSEKMHKVLNKFNVSFDEIVDFISIDYVATEGEKIFKQASNQASMGNIKTLNTYLQYSPILSIKYSIGWHLVTEYHKNEVNYDRSKKSSVKESELPQINKPIQYEGEDIWFTRLYNGASRRTSQVDWIFSNGGWQILKFTNGAAKKSDRISREDTSDSMNTERRNQKQNKLQLSTPFFMQISYGKNLFNTSQINTMFNHVAEINIKCNNFLSLNASTEILETMCFITQNGTRSNVIHSITPTIGVQGQLPLFYSKIIFMPYQSINAGVEITNLNTPQVEFIVTGKIGAKFFLTFANNNFGFFVDSNIAIKLGFTEFRAINSPLSLSLGIAF